jgi:hypothetical protein
MKAISARRHEGHSSSLPHCISLPLPQFIQKQRRPAKRNQVLAAFKNRQPPIQFILEHLLNNDEDMVFKGHQVGNRCFVSFLHKGQFGIVTSDFKDATVLIFKSGHNPDLLDLNLTSGELIGLFNQYFHPTKPF